MPLRYAIYAALMFTRIMVRALTLRHDYHGMPPVSKIFAATRRYAYRDADTRARLLPLRRRHYFARCDDCCMLVDRYHIIFLRRRHDLFRLPRRHATTLRAAAFPLMLRYATIYDY